MPMTRRLATLAVAVSLAAALGGCATSSADLSRATVGVYRDTIDLSGKVSVNYQRDGKSEPSNGNFTWQQRPGAIDVTLASPLGQTLAVINVTPGAATLTQAGQAPRSAGDIDSLSQQTLGWPLPVSGLRDWLQGYAIDAQGKRFRASPANNQIVTKDGWRLRFMSWYDETAPQPKPRVINAELSAAGDIQNLSIRIFIEPAGQ